MNQSHEPQQMHMVQHYTISMIMLTRFIAATED